MSKFFRALEQAERDRALREQGGHSPMPPPAPSEESPHDIVPGAVPVDVAPPEPSPRSPAPPPAVEPMPAPTPARPPRRRPAPAPLLFDEPPSGVDGHLVSLLDPTAIEAEPYRGLRHLIEQVHKSAGLSVVAISSPAAGDGKTTTAINLAGALAQDPKARVLLVDADLRAPALTDRLGLTTPRGRGLVEMILEPALALDDVVRPCPPFNLSLLPSGRRPGAPYELLKSPRLGEILEQARSRYDHVVLDVPPMVPFPDCLIIGRWVDGFILVVAAHKTPRNLVEEALRIMDPTKLVGLVFNRDDRPLVGYYSYGYGQAKNGDRSGWWGHAVSTLGAPLRKRRKHGAP